jgi:hypothetical protein
MEGLRHKYPKRASLPPSKKGASLIKTPNAKEDVRVALFQARLGSVSV